jgi:hypothetical protein
MKIFHYIDTKINEDREAGEHMNAYASELKIIQTAYHHWLKMRERQQKYRNTDKGREKSRIAARKYRERKKQTQSKM